MASERSLRARDLSFRYGAAEPWVIAGLSGHFPPGSMTLLTGRSGAGKSTLLYLLGSLLKPTSGTVSHGSVQISSLPDGQRAGWRATTTGFVFQDAALDPARTVLDNILEPCVYGAGDRRRRRVEALGLMEAFGVTLRGHARPGQISGGQAQRVALCRALISAPQIIFADEPTGNLDAESAGVVWAALTQAAEQGATVLVATHQPPDSSAAQVITI